MIWLLRDWFALLALRCKVVCRYFCFGCWFHVVGFRIMFGVFGC